MASSTDKKNLVVNTKTPSLIYPATVTKQKKIFTMFYFPDNNTEKQRNMGSHNLPSVYQDEKFPLAPSQISQDSLHWNANEMLFNRKERTYFQH